MRYREYTVTAVNQGITIMKDNEKKTVRVVDCTEFRYKLTKNKIYAAGGPDALVAWMEGLIKKDFGICWVSKILNYAWDEMKGVK